MNRNLKAKIAAKKVYDGNVDAFTSTAIKTAEIDSLAFLVSVDAGATVDAANKIDFTFEESQDGVTYAPASSESQYEGQVALNDAGMVGTTQVVEYRGVAPYVKIKGAKTGTTAGTMSVLALSLHPSLKPAPAGLI